MSFGRGRGFSDGKDIPLRRPGQSMPIKYNDLINFIANLSIKDATSGVKTDEIVQIINDAIKNKSLKEVYDELHEHALNSDRQFCIKLALACCDSKIHSINDNSLRLMVLQKLQKNYEEKDEIKQNSIFAFRNAVVLLGEVYNNLRISNRPMDIFANPLLDYLNILLETSEEPDVYIVTSQIYTNGRKIFDTIPTQLAHFIMKVRLVLINRNVSAKSRGMLLFIIDFANQNYAPLTELLKEFYLNDLDNKLLAEILTGDRSDNESTSKNNIHVEKDNAQSNIRTIITPTEQPSPDNAVSNSMKAARQKSMNAFAVGEKSPPNAVNERPVPRAIRGAGALDTYKDRNLKKSPRGKKDKLTDEQIWSSKQNTNSKNWGHDDRFEKDYD
ncbi:uncharacterized protein LOC106646039 [Copidosoma floridanum]|uniref:uncharacterized protein LOC106646039 n=1 Tax=Copidosoma floridanum TaxID=29053 RepID=UPI0006C9C816|nr:uncharacterized protein LOC106646039 [Copidosoma floridanum]